MKKVFSVGLVLALVALTFRPAAAADTKLLANVGAESITLEDLMLFLFQEQTGPIPPNVPVIPYMLDRMIVRKILVSAANEASLTVTDPEVQKFIETHKTQYDKNSQLFSDAALRNYIRDDMLNDKVIDKAHADIIDQNHIAITETDVKTEYLKRAKAGVFTEPERARFGYIILLDKDADGKPKKNLDKTLAVVAKALQDDPDFGAVAKKYSDNRNKAGDVNYDTKNALARSDYDTFPPEVLDEVFNKMNSGDPPKQVKLSVGTIFLKVFEKVPRVEHLYSEVKDALKSEMEDEKVQPLMKAWFDGLKKKYKVDFKVPFLEEMVQSNEGEPELPPSPTPDAQGNPPAPPDSGKTPPPPSPNLG